MNVTNDISKIYHFPDSIISFEDMFNKELKYWDIILIVNNINLLINVSRRMCSMIFKKFLNMSKFTWNFIIIQHISMYFISEVINLHLPWGSSLMRYIYPWCTRFFLNHCTECIETYSSSMIILRPLRKFNLIVISFCLFRMMIEDIIQIIEVILHQNRFWLRFITWNSIFKRSFDIENILM